MDETPIQVLKEPDKPPEAKSYIWCFIGGAPIKIRMEGLDGFWRVFALVFYRMWKADSHIPLIFNKNNAVAKFGEWPVDKFGE